MKLDLFLLFLLSAFMSCKSAPKLKQKFVPTFSIYKETTHKIPKGQEFTFGYLEVLENRNRPHGNTIKLPVYIFKSRSKNPKSDPIIYTVGGPGNTTMNSAPYMNYYQYLDDRDFILFEQRGTQYAQPSLDCPEWSEAIYRANLPHFDEEKRDSLFESAAMKCKKRLLERNIDLNSYQSNAIAADIEDLRKTLKIDRYNLLTLSYSTKIAQILLRDYPKAIRSVVMDSPLPLEVNYDEESVSNLMELVDKLLVDCESREASASAFPNIRNRFFDFLKEKSEKPLEIEVKNPNTGKLEKFYLRGEDLIRVFTSSNTNTIANVPFEIQKILDHDFTWLKEQLSDLFQKPKAFKGSGIAMRLSVWCAEEYPFTSPSRIESEKDKYPEVKGLSPAVFESSICDIWSVKSVNPRENSPVKSDIPVLLLSGEYDNETPVKWAKSMKKNLSNSHHLIFKGWKHGLTTNWSNPCGMQVANQFFNYPKEKPNLECFTEIMDLRFKTK